MTETTKLSDSALDRLRWPLTLTRTGMVAERALRSFWPLWTVLLLALAALMLGVHESLPLEVTWGLFVVGAAGLIATLWYGIRRFHWPSRAEALDRLDRTLPGRPISALADTQAIGSTDAASQAVWKAHVARMAERAASARAVEPNLRIADRDPYALRFVAALAFAVALLFGSFLSVATVSEAVPGGTNTVAQGPSWEGWVEPPAYTGKPSLYLNDIRAGSFEVPEASRVTIRLYGDVGDLTVTETVSGRTAEIPAASDASHSFEVTQAGRIAIEGANGTAWDISVTADTAPEVTILGDPERGLSGEMRQTFSVSDDYGVVSGRAEITLDLASIDRRYGLAPDPEPREPITLDLPMTISGDRAGFEEVLIENLSQHPWATLPVTMVFYATDDLGQEGRSEPAQVVLPGRRFFDPLANAIIEMRRDMLWNRDENGRRVAQVLRAVSYQPDDVFDSETNYLKLRDLQRELELFNRYGMTEDQRDQIAQLLWDLAVLIEDGSLSDALERLREARERLEEAMRNGATDEEIAELMRELREATQEYMRQLAEQQRQNGENQDGQEQAQGERQEITGDQIEALMERLQQLMEEGRMDEAMELMERLSQMLENLEVTEGEGQGSPGQEAMEGLGEMLRDQQDLSDETFGDLQDQFGQNQNGQQGERGQDGQQGNDGQQQGDGQGQGQGQGKSGPPNGSDGSGQGQGQGELDGDALAERQRALREELDRQRGNMPGAGTPEGDAAGEALDRAGRAMDEAEEALRNDDLAGALDNQSDAIEALREGMRNLGEMMAQEQNNQGQQGEAQGQADNSQSRDPLGREPGGNGQIGTEEEMLQGDDIYGRARELLEELRRRSAEQSRPEEELDYLRRLLDRF
ncbi:TIGR02302 family protein [Psychromarinibacter halotolerans]|uniref:TIGR02302 family protein n=1 Tax=Psychromarinibacter halotolerans TaxID=1775175 RepID=A0ABV7GM12_9RHOB|nr:TIGR02302 family protein [Psychromarinibacter halotolerans]MDF0598935.1 TIGR02302 family protein [Psychromarinibacter halotolerans]